MIIWKESPPPLIMLFKYGPQLLWVFNEELGRALPACQYVATLPLVWPPVQTDTWSRQYEGNEIEHNFSHFCNLAKTLFIVSKIYLLPAYPNPSESDW